MCCLKFLLRLLKMLLMATFFSVDRSRAAWHSPNAPLSGRKHHRRQPAGSRSAEDLKRGQTRAGMVGGVPTFRGSVLSQSDLPYPPCSKFRSAANLWHMVGRAQTQASQGTCWHRTPFSRKPQFPSDRLVDFGHTSPFHAAFFFIFFILGNLLAGSCKSLAQIRPQTPRIGPRLPKFRQTGGVATQCDLSVTQSVSPQCASVA